MHCDIDAGFDEHNDVPVDVIWLDIDEKKLEIHNMTVSLCIVTCAISVIFTLGIIWAYIINSLYVTC